MDFELYKVELSDNGIILESFILASHSPLQISTIWRPAHSLGTTSLGVPLAAESCDSASKPGIGYQATADKLFPHMRALHLWPYLIFQ